jgi:hypothetical protein
MADPEPSPLSTFRVSCFHCGHVFEVEYVVVVAAGYLPTCGIECPACGRANRRQFLEAVSQRFPGMGREDTSSN